MKKFTRVLVLTLVAALALSAFVGCNTTGNSLDPVADKDGNVTILIGGIGPLSGDYANYGLSVKYGCEIAVEEINAAGGVNGMKLALDFQDSQGSGEAALNAYGNLIDKGMTVSLGGVLSGETASIVAGAKDDGIFILTPTASAKDSIAGNDNAFRVCFNDPQQGTVSANVIAEKQLGTKIAVLYQSDIDYSKGLYDTFKAQCAAKNLQIVETQTFTKDSSTTFETQINAIKASGADLVFIPIYAAEAASFLTQAKAAGLDNVAFFGCDGLDGIQNKGVTNDVIEGVMMLTPFAADSQEADVVSFVTKYNQKTGKDPDQFAADGYDAIYVIKAAIEKAGFNKDNVKDFQKGLVEAMTKITVDGVTGTMTWTADGETNKTADVLIFQDGVAMNYDRYANAG